MNLHHQIDFNKSLFMDLPSLVDIRESTKTGWYWWIYPNGLTLIKLYRIVDIKNLSCWVNIDECTLLSQYWQIYIDESISTLQYQQIFTLRWYQQIYLSQYQWIYINVPISTNKTNRVNIDESTSMCWYQQIYTSV